MKEGEELQGSEERQLQDFLGYASLFDPAFAANVLNNSQQAFKKSFPERPF